MNMNRVPRKARGGSSLRALESLSARTAAPGFAGLLLTFCAQPAAWAFDAVVFDADMLWSSRKGRVDVSRFERGVPVFPGAYDLAVHVNGRWVTERRVRFASESANEDAKPCMDEGLLSSVGVDLNQLTPQQREQISDPRACVALSDLFAQSQLEFDLSEHTLHLTVPQASLAAQPRGYTDPASWSNGIAAARLNYSLSGYHSRFSAGGPNRESSQVYGTFDAGINLGSVRLRHRSSQVWDSTTGHDGDEIATYAQTDIPAWQARAIVGDYNTSGTLFDSIGLRGVFLDSDDRMLPDSLRGYAPVVRGVADTNARVTIRQNGHLLLEVPVSPGPFEIRDLYPTGYGGDLDVTVTEADGRLKRFSVPYASVVQLVRPGHTRFGLAAGRWRTGSTRFEPTVMQGTVQRGLSNTVTAYGGIQKSSMYAGLMAGAALSTPWGAFALDASTAKTDRPSLSPSQRPSPGSANESDLTASAASGASDTGYSFRLSYSKLLPQTNTSLAVAAYRYSTRGYWSLQDAVVLHDIAQRGGNIASIERERNRFDVVVNQRLGESGGSVYANLTSRNYWNRQRANSSAQLGYQKAFGQDFHYASLNASVTRVSYTFGQASTLLYAGVSVPLGPRESNVTASTSVRHDSRGSRLAQVGVSGSLGERNQLTYAASAAHANQAGQGSSGNASLSYLGQYGAVSGGSSFGDGYQQWNANVEGGVLVHSGGVTLGQTLGETVGLVQATDGEGAALSNYMGPRVDARGYALVSHLSPYRMNMVELDPRGTDPDVQFDWTVQRVAPRAGAVVLLPYKTTKERSAVLHVTFPDGNEAPMGAQVSNESGAVLGQIGRGGMAHLRGLAEEGRLQLEWGTTQAQRCSLTYQLPPKERNTPEASALTVLEAHCVPARDISAIPGSPRE